MAIDDRTTDNPIIQRLTEEGFQFSFFQAIRLLESYQKDLAAPGEGGPPWEEGIRFRPSASLSFPAADVQRIERVELPDAPEETFLVTVNFMGLYGVNAPTPTYFTELICSSDSDEDSMRDFLDIFNHRLISLFYRAWKKYRYSVTFLSKATDDISGYLLYLCGLGAPSLRRHAELPFDHLIRYTGLFSQRPRSATGLKCLLGDYFGKIPVSVEQFVFRWVKIPENQKNRIGTDGRNNQLGVNLCAGEQLKDRSGKMRIALGPLTHKQFEMFLPGGEEFEVLQNLVSMYAPDRLEFDIKLILKGEEIPPLWVTTPGSSRLGYSSWLVSEQREDAAIVFDPGVGGRSPVRREPAPSEAEKDAA